MQMGEIMKNIYNIKRVDLENYFLEKKDKKFRATQIYEALYKQKVKSFDEISGLGKNSVLTLKADYSMISLKIKAKEEDKDVVKYLFELEDGNKIESVLMLHDYGNSLCISTQVGCNMGCLFCESGKLKKIRNLDTHEMVLQILMAEEDIKKRISHIVLMGIGEPFDNYDNVMDFIRIINDHKGLDIGIRHITLSTSGIISKIETFIEEGLPVNLAISLHAPNNEIRSKLMPINKVDNIEKLMKVLKKYINKTNRRVTFEYILLEDINDSDELAIELAQLLKGINCYVNLIPYNETSNSLFKKTQKVKIIRFYDILKKHNINVTIRKEFGEKISAACGQLRATSDRR